VRCQFQPNQDVVVESVSASHVVVDVPGQGAVRVPLEGLSASPAVHSMLDEAKKGCWPNAKEILERLPVQLWGHYATAQPFPRRYALIHFAAEQDKEEIVASLLRYHADPCVLTRPNESGRPLAASFITRSGAIRDRLRNAEALRLLELASSRQIEELRRVLVAQRSREQPALVAELMNRIPDGSVQPLLHEVVLCNDPPLVKLVLDLNADVNGLSLGDPPRRAVEVATAGGASAEVLRQLAQEENGDAPAHHVLNLCKVQQWDAALTVLRKVPDLVNRRPAPRQFNCLHFACWFKREDVVTELLALGGDPGVRTKNGDTALDVARTEVLQAPDMPALSATPQLLERLEAALGENRAVAPPSALLIQRRAVLRVRETDLQQLEELSPIGRGSFGTVSQAVYHGAPCAVKKVKMDAQVAEELAYLQCMDHPHIIRLFACTRVRGSGTEQYVTQLARGGDLRQALHSIRQRTEAPVPPLPWIPPFPWIRALLRGCLSALCYMCNLSAKVVHQDIKPANIVVVSGEGEGDFPHVALVDMGISVQLNQEVRAGAGTPRYKAPEAWKRGRVTPAFDMFSLGCVLFYLASGGHHAYDCQPGLSEEQAKEAFLLMHAHGPGTRIKGGVAVASGPTVNQGVRELVSQMVCGTPDRRITPARALQHHWVLGEAWCPAPSECGQEQLQRFMRYAQLNPVVKGTLLVIATQLEEPSGFGPMFQDLNPSSTGVLTLKEWCDVLGRRNVQSWHCSAFHGMDLAGTGEVTYTEFSAACVSYQLPVVRKLLPRAFAIVSKGRSSLTFDQVQQIMVKDLRNTELQMREGRCDPWISELVQPGGVVDQERWCKFVVDELVAAYSPVRHV